MFMKMLKIIRIHVLLLPILVLSCKNEFVVVDGLTREDIIQLSEVERTKLPMDQATRAKLFKYKYDKDIKSHRISGKEKEIIRQLRALSVPEAFDPGQNEIKDKLNRIGEQLDSLLWNETKLYLFTGTILTIEEFVNKLPEGYILDEDYNIVDTQENKLVSLADFMIEYCGNSGKGGQN